MAIEKTICECGRTVRHRYKKMRLTCYGCLRYYEYNSELDAYAYAGQLTAEYKRPNGAAGSPGDLSVRCALKSIIY